MVFIVPPTGKILSLDINPNTTTLHNLKLLIEQFYGISISQQHIFLSQSLPLLGDNDSVLVSNLGVGNYSTITLYVPFNGGTQPPAVHNSDPPAGHGRGATGITARSDIGPANHVTHIPLQTEVNWLKEAKEKWLAGDVPAARAILQEAYAAIPNSEAIWLAAFKLEYENQELERAGMLLAKARERVGTERVWMKSAIVERELGNSEEERKLLNEGLEKFPSFYKLWLMLGQLEERLAEAAMQEREKCRAHKMEAKKVYWSGLERVPNSVPLWLSIANIEEEMSEFSKVRAVLFYARKKNPQNPELWLASVRKELKHGYLKEADYLMSKSLQACPKSGILWACSIDMTSLCQLREKCNKALIESDNDPHVIASIAKLFWIKSNVDKARSWLNRAVTLAPDIGDFWALCYIFELRHGTEENQKDVLKRCVAAKPKHGEKWQAISKAVENSHQPTEFILEKVATALDDDDSHRELR